MRKRSVVFELTDDEIRAFWFSAPAFRNPGHSSTPVKFDRISIPTGIIQKGNVLDENALIGILSNYRVQNSRKIEKAYLAIPLQQAFIQSYTLPWISKRDRKSAISLLVDEEIPIARSDLRYDFLVTSEERQISLQVLLGATRQSLVEKYVFAFGQAEFKVTGVDFSFSVLGQALAFEPNEDVLYLQGEPTALYMVLFRGAVPEIIRTLPALPKTEDSAETTKGRMVAWGNEIRRLLLYYRTQQADLKLKRLVWSGDAVAEQLAQELLQTNHVSSVEQAQLRSVPSAWRQVLEDNRGSCEVVVGYGLQISAKRSQLNLWRQSNDQHFVYRTYQGIVLFACALLMAGTMTWVLIYQKTIPLKQEVEQLSDQGAKLMAQGQHKEALEVAWRKVKIDSEKIGTGLIQVQAMSSSELTIENVSFKRGNLSLSGSARNTKSVQTLIQTLCTMGWEQPALTSYKMTSLNTVEFSISAKCGQVIMEPESNGENRPEEMTQNMIEDTSESFDERG